MSEITEVKISEGQDLEATSDGDKKITVSIVEPTEEVWTIDTLKAAISEYETYKQNALINYNNQIAIFDLQIAKYVSILSEAEKIIKNP